jgi:hypothetical protein
MTNYSIQDFRERLDQRREKTPEHRSFVVSEAIMEELLQLISMPSRSYVAKRPKIDSVLLARRIKFFESERDSQVEFVEVSPMITQDIKTARVSIQKHY